MSFSKCSNLETKNVMHFKGMKGRTMIFNEKKTGFTHWKIKTIEKFKLKIKLTEKKF